MPTPHPDSTQPVGDTHAAQRALNIGRTTLYSLLKNDPEFPKPIMIAGKLTFFMNEIETYKATRPRRQYSTLAA